MHYGEYAGTLSNSLELYRQYRGILGSIKTSFLLKSNGPNDLNKMIRKFYGCKIGQGE